MVLQAWLLGKVFSVKNGGSGVSEDGESDSDMNDETVSQTDDQILGLVLNQYQTRHTIIDSQAPDTTTSVKAAQEDPDFFKYEEGANHVHIDN